MISLKRFSRQKEVSRMTVTKEKVRSLRKSLENQTLDSIKESERNRRLAHQFSKNIVLD